MQHQCITLDLLPPIAWLFNLLIGVPAEDDDFCIDEGVCVVVGTAELPLVSLLETQVAHQTNSVEAREEHGIPNSDGIEIMKIGKT